MLSSIPAHIEIKVMPWEKLKQLKPENIIYRNSWIPSQSCPGRVSSLEIQIENENLCQKTITINYLQLHIEILPDSSAISGNFTIQVKARELGTSN